MTSSASPAERAAIIEREKRFFDSRAQAYARTRALISRAIGSFDRSREMHELYDPVGRTVLDYGCGEGRFSFRLLEAGAATVTGIDVSEARVATARERAADLGLEHRARFEVADAHDTGLPSTSFDLVIGSDVLHHLDVPAALSEIRRLLVPGGRAVFVEPLAHHPLLRLGRRLTPAARTPDEHPLTVDDLRLMMDVFPGFRHGEREFLTIPLMPLNLVLPARAGRWLAQRLARVDDALLRRQPWLRRYARRTILLLTD